MTFRVPKLQQHKATGQGRVSIDGRDIYFGKYGSEECDRRYRRFCMELAETNRAKKQPDAVTVEDVLAQAWLWAKKYYVGPDGKPTS